MLSIISTWIGEPSHLERLILHRASVSLHALGRWFQRIGPRANDDLLRCALAPLAQADQQEVLRADGTFAIEATGGVWLGEKVHDTAGVITLAARTFRD